VRRSALLLALLLLPSTAGAQAAAMQVERYEGRPSDAGVLGQPVSSVLARHSLSLELGGLYTQSPLLLLPEADGLDPLSPIPRRLGGELLAAYGLLGWGQIGLVLPWSSPLGPGDSGWAGHTVDDLGAHALGDLRLSFDADLVNALAGGRSNTRGLGVGVGATLWLPTGDDAALAGEPLPRGALRAAVDWTGPLGLTVGGNVGVHLREASDLADYPNRSELRWGASLAVPLGLQELQGVATVFGAVPLDPEAVSASTTPVELLGGVRFRHDVGLRVQLAAGGGLTPAVGAPEFRVVGQIGWTFRLPRKPTNELGDDDGDGILNRDDRCPLEPETADSIRDEDGCPEANVAQVQISTSDPGVDVGPAGEYRPADVARLPRLKPAGAPAPVDGDAVAERFDLCPDQDEDVDGFEDEDGCPDPDNDGDGILDVDDRCPLEAESADGRQDEDGCPEGGLPDHPEPTGADTDGDGVLDAADRCPLEPETANGVRDFDGCPEAPEALVIPGGRKPFGAPGEPTMEEALPRNGDRDGDGVADLSDACPEVMEDRDGFEDGDGCPEIDNDGDGVVDRVDRCPLEAENVNGVLDGDGCPDVGPDEDGDGVDDDKDRCPLEPENRDGVRDEDGCPEAWWAGLPAPVGSASRSGLPATAPRTPGRDGEADVALIGPLPRAGDRDGDGIDHAADACPDEAEDVDGFLDGDGCPEPDNDGDGVLDADDACPLEAEAFNGYRDDDGCPDAVPVELVKVSGVVRGIQFRSGSAVLLRSSSTILGSVRDALAADAELSVDIAGHTDSVGDRARNLALSEERAASVAAWLRAQGVAPDRITVAGFGPDQPLAPNDTNAGRAENRRVELSYRRKEASP
jgi:outer membrane protein OmpA-like peptidoglycan-associated protein